MHLFLYLNWADCIFCKVEYIYQTYSEWWANRDMELTRNQGRLCERDRVHAYYTISILSNTLEVEFKPNHKIYQSLACCSLQLMASCFITLFFGVFLEVGFILPSRPRTIPKKRFPVHYSLLMPPKKLVFWEIWCFFQSWGCQFIHGSPIALHVFFSGVLYNVVMAGTWCIPYHSMSVPKTTSLACPPPGRLKGEWSTGELALAVRESAIMQPWDW